MVLTEGEILEVKEAYRKYGGNATEAARNLDFVSQSTILNMWKKRDIK